MELIRNKETGIVEGWENGEKVGEIITMGDMVSEENEDDKDNSNER